MRGKRGKQKTEKKCCRNCPSFINSHIQDALLIPSLINMKISAPEDIIMKLLKISYKRKT